MTAVNIYAGFQTTGIYPLNADALKLPCQTKSNSDIIHSTVAFTPAKRDVLDLEKEKRDVCDSGEEDISPNPDDAALESPLISVSDYRPAKQRTTLQMLDINTVLQRQASTKPKKDEDPSLLLLTSSENVARMEAKKDKNKNKGKGKKQRSKAVTKRTREFVFCKLCVSNCHCTIYVHVHVHVYFHTGFSDGTLPGSQSDEESHLGAHGECMNIVDAITFYPYMYVGFPLGPGTDKAGVKTKSKAVYCHNRKEEEGSGMCRCPVLYLMCTVTFLTSPYRLCTVRCLNFRFRTLWI